MRRYNHPGMEQGLLIERRKVTSLSILYASINLLRKKLQKNLLSYRKYCLQPNYLETTIVLKYIPKQCREGIELITCNRNGK